MHRLEKQLASEKAQAETQANDKIFQLEQKLVNRDQQIENMKKEKLALMVKTYTMRKF